MKYEHLNEIKPDSSLGKFLAQITPDSVVLECGCASGYMTRVLKEKLDCQVYIVEYNPEGYENAIQYAVDGVCGDLMQDHWEKKFANVKFDYILFADVLEHLTDPLSVLKAAVKLLKDSGSVMVSLPNIGHNDVLVRLIQGNWNYTPTGLLDDTHVHFWGVNNLDNFFRQAGLEVVIRDCVLIGTGHTEQCDEAGLVLTDEIYAVIRERPEGEIYQFALTLKKSDYLIQHDMNRINLFPTTKSQSLPTESLQELRQELLNKDGHIQQLLQSERDLQGSLRSKDGHIEQLLQRERELLAENERKASEIRKLQYDLGYQASMADHARRSEAELRNQLNEARDIIDKLQYELGCKIGEQFNV